MKKTPKNIPSPYKFPGTPIFRDTTALPFADGGPLNDRTNHGKILNSVYASALGNYYPLGGSINYSNLLEGEPKDPAPINTTRLVNTDAQELRTKNNEIVNAGRSKKWEFDPITGSYYTTPLLKLPTKSLSEIGAPTPEITPSPSFAQKVNTPNKADFAYRQQAVHEYDKDTKKFSKDSSRKAPLPYAEKYSSGWEANDPKDLPESGFRVWAIDGKEYYNQEEAKAAANALNPDSRYIKNTITNNQYKDGGQFQGNYSLPEDSFRQGGNNLHDSIYASSPQQYPGIYNLGGNLDDRQQMYMPLDHVTRNGGSILSMSNTPQMAGEGKDLTYPEDSYAYADGGPLYTYAGRPGAKYQKDTQGNWLINTSGEEFTPIKDPTGKRSAILNKNATIYTNPAKFKREYDPLLDIPAVIGDNTVVRNNAVVDKNLTANTVNQKKLERDIVASKIKNSPMLSEEQKTDTLLDPRKLDEYSYLAYGKEPEVLKAAKEYSTLDKIENVVRNPLVAATYAMQPGAFNMPMNYSELERSPDYSDETWNKNAMGQGINAARYFHPVGLAASAADNLIYTGDDARKAIKSGKSEDWQKAGMSGVNTALDLLGSRYIGNSGRLLNAGEQATLNAMNTSNKLGLNPGVNNYLGTKVFPSLSTSGIQSADNLVQANLFPQLNPMSPKYNPLIKNLYNKGVTAGHAQNIGEATELGGKKVFGTFGHDIETNPNIVYKKSESGNTIPFNTETGKSLQEEYINNITEYYNSPEFKRIMKEEHPDVDIEQYKKVTLDNLQKELTYNPDEVPEEYGGAYTLKNSSLAVYPPWRRSTFAERVNNANTNKLQILGRGQSHINDPSAAWHELSHQRTNADELLPNELTRSHLEENADPFAEDLQYHAMPTEFDVRLRQLKEDLKTQGINDYFKTPVTEEHINMLDAAKLKAETEDLLNQAKFKYRELKASGAPEETLKNVQNQYYDNLKLLENKMGNIKTSTDTQDLLTRWSPEFLAKKARTLPALFPAIGVAGGAALANPWQEKPKGL